MVIALKLVTKNNMNKCTNCGVTSEEIKCTTCNADMVAVEEMPETATEAAEATATPVEEAAEETTTEASPEAEAPVKEGSEA